MRRDDARHGGGDPAWIRLILLVVVPLAAYANGVGGEFLQDDVTVIEQNVLIRDLSHLPRILASPYREGTPTGSNDYLYRPLTIASYAFSTAVRGVEPFAFHLVNLLLHLGVVAVLYRVLALLSGSRDLAFVAALLYGVHPVLSEAVTNVSGRGELLAALLGLVAWRFLLRDPLEERRRSTLVLAATFYFLALLSKESAIALPGLVILGDAWLRSERRPGTSLARGAVEAVTAPGAWRTIASLAVVAGVYLGIRAAVLGGLTLPREEIPFLDNPTALAPARVRVVTALSVIGRYVGLLVAPVHLTADYSHSEIPVLASVADPWVALGAVWFAAAAVLALACSSRMRLVAFGLLFFWIAISVASNLPFPVGTIMAERLLYLPGAGFCVILAVGLLAVRRREVRWGLVGALAVVFAIRTVDRNADWRDREVFAAVTARSSPGSAKARFNHGNILLGRAREVLRQEGPDRAAEAYDAARAEYRAAVTSYPEYAKAWLNLGGAALEIGDVAEAEKALREAARIEPRWDAPWFNLGRVRVATGDSAGAVEAFEQAAKRTNQPRQASLIYLELGRAREARGDREGARKAFEASLEHDPRNPDALVHVAAYRLEEGRAVDARELLRTALRIAPSHPEALRLHRLLDSRTR